MGLRYFFLLFQFSDKLKTHTFTVVLLDEADVFLEQRSLVNLERNALVSGQYGV